MHIVFAELGLTVTNVHTPQYGGSTCDDSDIKGCLRTIILTMTMSEFQRR